MKDLRSTTNLSEIDVPVIHEFLSNQSSLAKGISHALVSKSIEHRSNGYSRELMDAVLAHPQS